MSTSDSAKQVSRQIWLLYFNKTLLEKGVITEKEHNRMKLKMQAKTTSK